MQAGTRLTTPKAVDRPAKVHSVVSSNRKFRLTKGNRVKSKGTNRQCDAHNIEAATPRRSRWLALEFRRIDGCKRILPLEYFSARRRRPIRGSSTKDCASDFRRSPIASPCRVSIIGRPSPAVFWRVRNLTFAVETHDNFSVNGHSATFNGPFLKCLFSCPTLPFIQ